MLPNSAFQVVRKQKKFIRAVVKKFASVFTQQIAKLVEVVKAREEKKAITTPRSQQA